MQVGAGRGRPGQALTGGVLRVSLPRNKNASPSMAANGPYRAASAKSLSNAKATVHHYPWTPPPVHSLFSSKHGPVKELMA